MSRNFKKTKKVKLDLLTQIDMLLMIEKEIREEYVFLFIDIQEVIANT